MGTGVKMVVFDVQRQTASIPTGKTNVERGVEYSKVWVRVVIP